MKHNDVKIGSNRSFGIVFFVVFVLIAIYPLINDDEIRLWSLVISIIFLILGIFNSKLLTPLNRIWFKFGLLLGKIISPVIMFLVYFTVVTPTGLLLRLFNKDILNLKFNKKSSYWINKEKNIGTMKDQF